MVRKESIFRKVKFISLYLADFSLIDSYQKGDKKFYKVRFYQQYTTDKKSDKGYKTLLISCKDDRCVIQKESWQKGKYIPTQYRCYKMVQNYLNGAGSGGLMRELIKTMGRKNPIVFEKRPPANYSNRPLLLNYSKVSKTLGNFSLSVDGGTIHRGEVIGILGPNGIGKTTFVKILAGVVKPDEGNVSSEDVKVSYKPQYISSDYDGTVRDLLMSIANINTSFYKSEIIKPLSLEKIMDFDVKDLSGGELQRVAIAACLSRDADIYLIDEPSAFLDVEQRLNVSRTIRRMADEKDAAMFVVDHDILFQDYISDRFIVFSGEAGKIGKGSSPLDKRSGANKFLKEMNITFRRDPDTGRPRVNKEGSQRDLYQKEIGEYYYVDE
jgi:ATP-binding cassette subfamily E protein 1